tara:strand:- start:16606 stop:18237 length:1632 start_codon:yes stop_codon:yes gene_type:complete
MTFNSGTATDHLDMLDQLVEVLTSRHLATVAINAGGTGHAIGDIIDITATGSTSTHLCKIEVVTLAGSAIATARVYRGGAYTVDPTTTTANAQSASTGAGTGATFDLTFAATGWTQLQRNSELDTADSIAAAGTGYSIGDDLTLIGGVLAEGGSAATLNVDTLSGSGVATVSILTRGEYEVFPSDPVLTSVSPSGGTGCTLNLTPRNLTGETVVTLQGDAGSSIDPLVGIKTYSDISDQTSLNTVFNWALFGLTAWSATDRLDQQANITQGFDTSANDGTLTPTLTTGTGSYVPMKDSDAFNMVWSIRADGRSFALCTRVESATTNYNSQCAAGLLNSYGTTTELPFPAFVAGATDRRNAWWKDVGSAWGGLADVVGQSSSIGGPVSVWQPEGSWVRCIAGIFSGATDTTPSYTQGGNSPRTAVWPLGNSNAHEEADDQIFEAAPTSGFDNDRITAVSSRVELFRTPNTGEDLFALYPVTYMRNDSATDIFRTFGELPGVFWFHVADATISSEDRWTQYPDAYSIFQNGTRIDTWSFLALKED